MSANCLTLVTYIFDSFLCTGYFSVYRKYLNHKVTKAWQKKRNVTFYRIIRLLAVLSKVFKKLCLQRLKSQLEVLNIIPITNLDLALAMVLNKSIRQSTKSKMTESKRYCSATFLDMCHAFDNVWHKILYCKLKKDLPLPYSQLILSYVFDRLFLIKHNNRYTELYPTDSRIPQGNILCPILHHLYTSHLPITRNTMTTTFSDHTAILTIHPDPTFDKL